MRKPHVAGAGIEAVVSITAVGMKDQPCCAFFVAELHVNFQIKWKLRTRAFSHAQGSTAERRTCTVDNNSGRALFPFRPEHRRPETSIQRADRFPAGQRHGVWFVDQLPNELCRQRVADAVLHSRFHCDQSDNLTVRREHGTAAVARFDGHRQFQHANPVHLIDAGIRTAGHLIAFASRVS